MSLKDNVDYIKKEISAEESYMENFFKVEKLLKKYKSTLIATSAVIVISIVGYYVSSYYTQQNKIQANEAFNILLQNPNDADAKAILKVKNAKLYEIFQYKLDDSKVTNVEFFKELALYTQAIDEASLDKIDTVTQKQDFLLKDFALFNKALIQAKNTQYTDAKETLKLIDQKSEVLPMAKMLEHFLLTK